MNRFIIIGMSKSGTKALWFNLNKHPDICIGTSETFFTELRYWGDINYFRGREWYDSRFKKDAKWLGDKSHYLENQNSLKIIKENIPNTKFILCLREPVSRIIKNYQKNILTNAVDVDFGPIRNHKFEDIWYLYRRFSLYHELLTERFLPFFSMDQVHICIMERMKKNLTKEMGKIFDFLELKDLNYKPKLVSSYRTDIDFIYKNMLEKSFIIWEDNHEDPEDKFKEKLFDHFKIPNEKLFDLLGYEIKEWRNG